MNQEKIGSYVGENPIIESKDIVLKNLDCLNIREKSVNYVCARPGNCKSQMLINIIKQVSEIKNDLTNSHDYNSLVFSLEMARNDVEIRLRTLDPSYFDKQFIQESGQNVAICEERQLSVLDIKKIIFDGEIYTKKKVHFVFIDYVQLIEGNYEEISKDLVKLAEEMNIIIFAAAQLNPGFKLEKIKEATNFIAGTSRFAKDATTMIVLQRGNPGEIGLDVAKNRFGNLLENPKRMHFEINGEIKGETNLYATSVFSEQEVRAHEAAQLCLYGLFMSDNHLASQRDGTGEDYNHVTKEIKLITYKNLGTDLEKHLKMALIGLVADNYLTNTSIPRFNQLEEIKLNEILEKKYSIETGINCETLTPETYKDFEKGCKKESQKARKGIIKFLELNKLIIVSMINNFGKKYENEITGEKEVGNGNAKFDIIKNYLAHVKYPIFQ